MKQQIYCYKLYLFGHKGEDDYLNLSQEKGQQLSMILSSDSSKKFILIGDDLINTSAIEQLIRCEAETYDFQVFHNVKDIRELTPSEEKMQKLFDDFKGKNKLLN